MYKKMMWILVFFLIANTLSGARQCSNLDFGIGNTVGNTNEYNISTYPLPLEIKARSMVFKVDNQTSTGVVTEYTRIRRDMFFRITRKSTIDKVSSIFNIMSVVNTQE